MITAVFTFGRFSPPSIGHSILFRKMLSLGEKYKASAIEVYASPVQDHLKNPIEYQDKIRFLSQLLDEKYPGVDVINTSSRNIIEILQELDKEYERVVLVVGGDRIEEFTTLLNKYNGNLYNFEEILVFSAGHRDPDADDASGMSATKMRKAAVNGDFTTFRKGIDSFNMDLIRDIYAAVKRGMRKPPRKKRKSVRDAISYSEVHSYCRLLEQGEVPEEDLSQEDAPSEEKPSDLFLQRVQALFQKAGKDFPVDEEGSTESNLEPSAEGLKLLEKYRKDLKSFQGGTVGVLFIDQVLGTKFTIEYIGRIYKILVEAFPKTEGLLVVSRRLRGMSAERITSTEMNLPIAWESKISNVSYIREIANMKVNFIVSETEDLFKEINARELIVSTLGNLQLEDLQGWVNAFMSQKEKTKSILEKINLESLPTILRKQHMDSLHSEAVSKEQDARQDINALAVKGKRLITQRDLQDFNKKYFLDPLVIYNELQVKMVEGKTKIPEAEVDELTAVFKEQADALGVTPVLMLADAIRKKVKGVQQVKKALPKEA